MNDTAPYPTIIELILLTRPARRGQRNFPTPARSIPFENVSSQQRSLIYKKLLEVSAERLLCQVKVTEPTQHQAPYYRYQLVADFRVARNFRQKLQAFDELIKEIRGILTS